MTDNMQRAPLTTVVYVAGSTPSERKQKARTTLAHAVNNCGETWLAQQPGFDANVAGIVEFMEESIEESGDDNPGGGWESEESDYREPIHRVRVAYDVGPSRSGLGGIVSGVKSADGRHIDVIMTRPDDAVTRATGVDPLQDIVGNGAAVRFAESGVALTTGTDIEGATKRVVMTLSDALHPRHADDDPASYAHTGGRPPLGFEVQDGRLVEGEDYRTICTRLQQVVDQKISKNYAAKKIGCARGTIINAIEERPEMYNLDV